MKTSLVVKLWGTPPRFERGAVPSDGTEPKYVPHYSPAHRAHGWNGSVNEWDEPESVRCLTGGYLPKKGLVPEIRTMPETYIEQLSEIDRQRDELNEKLRQLREQEKDILKTAYPVSKAVTLQNVKDWTEEKKRKAKA